MEPRLNTMTACIKQHTFDPKFIACIKMAEMIVATGSKAK